MALTPRGIWTPDSGEEYDLTVDAATTASTIDNALQKSANYGLGTTAEMNAALGDLPNGAMWFNTTNSREYRRVSGAWVDQSVSQPFAMAVGTVQVSFSNSNSGSSVISFPAGRFTQTPAVFASVQTTTGQFNIAGAFASSPSSGTVFMRRTDSAAQTNTLTASWMAVQMTQGSAEG